ncbi:nascent polypeptide-associated complex subunit beta [Babesia microti strain RI]|uniref:Nascent polypeptide-associated complex subunit beta n=1 Tax=Babesia microti (strain RI) TaxID=1133968 RepID=I7I854_BABMR|nr:nascent polypeptide-associated complex subunit beta [Babesia microti strain RI]CCF72888.1 nascent polypeptide-associated complex subunit beta [Babesia microti strain RI]|eukprot:XP_012647497.1 nascent polypeptide-associated complex subunit beta [Babesia microti strain RI]
MAVIAGEEITPEMLAARAKLREKLGAIGQQTGGKGTVRRKAKRVFKPIGDDKKMQVILKRLGTANIPGIEEVQMIKDDGNMIHIVNPKIQASPSSNTYVISGNAEEKAISIPQLLDQLNAAGIDYKKHGLDPEVLKQFNGNDNDDIPELVESFEETSINT